MSRTSGTLVGVLLLAALAGCGGSTPAGTLSEDDLPDSVEVKNVTHDRQANQSLCQDINDAEDEHVMGDSPSFEKDKRAAVSFDISKGSTHEYVGNSVWRLTDPKAAVAAVAKGLEACAKANPENYKPISVEGYPGAVGYDAKEYRTPVFTRRILVPLKDRVVIVSVSRDGSDHYSVPPEDLLKKAIAASDEAPKA
jgi:hypothetical protein